MKIDNVRVYGLDESIVASAYPMRTEVIEKLIDEKDCERAIKLGKCKSASGHDCYLKGVIVQADITAPQYWWLQWGRYHFADIVSSQSKMHRILKMDIDKQCNEYVDEEIKSHLSDLIYTYNTANLRDQEYREVLFQRIIANTPMGLKLTARITTNYLQLKTIYKQRHAHKLEEWRDIFCPFLFTLPSFKELVGEQCNRR